MQPMPLLTRNARKKMLGILLTLPSSPCVNEQRPRPIFTSATDDDDDDQVNFAKGKLENFPLFLGSSKIRSFSSGKTVNEWSKAARYTNLKRTHISERFSHYMGALCWNGFRFDECALTCV